MMHLLPMTWKPEEILQSMMLQSKYESLIK
jgi:hypothetical protein